MNKRIRNTLMSGLLASVMAVSAMNPIGTVWAANTQAAEQQARTVYKGNNINAQNYTRWASTIKSYLVPCGDGRQMRVQYIDSMKSMVIEYYDASYQLTSSKTVATELPIFGGFYMTDQYYFVLTGQENGSESQDTEVYRITKYDKDWNKIDAAGLKGANTTVPFDAGSARMDVSGKYLLIRTSHEMYRSDDGYNHQANVTIQLDMDTMTITDSFTKVSNTGSGYVSHSFNQFIKVENGRIVAVDHGDAYPRSIVLTKYQNDLSGGKFSGSCTTTNVLEFPGQAGQNTTGASVGGFEISGTSYLVAGNSVVQDSSNLSRKTRNVFVASVDKNSNAVNMNWLTNYNEGEESATTPQMVKVNENQYIVLWSKANTVYYTAVDGSGQTIDKVYELQGSLSDCVPMVANGKLVWYTWNNDNIAFYEIMTSDLSKTQIKETKSSTDSENGTGSTPGTSTPGSGTGGTPSTDLTKNEYTVTFHANGGTIIGNTTLTTVDQKLASLPEAYQSGYTFEGWYTSASGGSKVSSSTVFAQDCVLYAHWKENAPKEYTITLNANGGTIVGNTTLTTVNQKLASLPEAYRSGYTFEGWYMSTSGGSKIGSSTVFAQDCVLYAHWKENAPKEYTITLNANGGTIVGNTTLTTVNQKLASLPEAYRSGYTFEGWYDSVSGGTRILTSKVFDTDRTIYAQWAVIKDTSSNIGTDIESDTGTKSDTESNTTVNVKKVQLQKVKSSSKGKMKVSWKRYGAVSGYQVAYSKSKSFPSKKTTVKKVNAVYTSKTFSSLSKGKTYYVRVRAYKKVNGKNYYGSWSNVKKVKIKK